MKTIVKDPIELSLEPKDGIVSFSAKNAGSPLVIPTYEGSGEAMHPDVLYFKDWLWGYKFWMAFTPYPGGNRNYENPSIAMSKNGVDWEVTPRLNPLDFGSNDFTDQKYNSDTDLYYEDGTMYCIYRQLESIPSKPPKVYERIYMQSSTDGINWGDKMQLFYTTGYNAATLSPAIVSFNNHNTYRIYTVNAVSTEGILQYREAGDIDYWPNPPVNCQIDYTPPGKKIWHINITLKNGIFFGIFTYCDSDSHGNNSVLYIALSKDGVNWTVQRKALLLPSENGWDNWMIYRSSLVEVDGAWWLYYSGVNHDGHWHTALTNVTYDIQGMGIKLEKSKLTLEVL